jgi:hypothetical protein
VSLWCCFATSARTHRVRALRAQSRDPRGFFGDCPLANAVYKG